MVSVPAPAIIGKAMGITVEPFGLEICGLKISLFNVISKPIKNITIAPARENDTISIPITFNTYFPAKRKVIMIPPDTKVANLASISPILFLISNSIGIVPKISIIANNTKLIVMTLLNSIDMVQK